MSRNTPNLMKTPSTDPRTSSKPSTMNMKKTTPTHIIIKLLKISDKEKILKAARKQLWPVGLSWLDLCPMTQRVAGFNCQSRHMLWLQVHLTLGYIWGAADRCFSPTLMLLSLSSTPLSKINEYVLE